MKMRAAHDWLAVIVVVLVCFAGAVMFSPVGRAVKKPNTDAFLDAPLPPGFVPHVFDDHVPSPPGLKVVNGPDWVSYGSYQERLEALKNVSPRPLILPEGFSDFIAKVNDRVVWNHGPILFSNERDGIGNGGKTYREFMTPSFKTMGLDLKYDPSRNALVADFPWHHEDTRSSQELLHTLQTLGTEAQFIPVKGETITGFPWRSDDSQTGRWLLLAMKNNDPVTQNIVHTIADLPAKTDTWLSVFDTLLSKPENFADAWKLRFLDDVSSREPGVIVYAAALPDEKAKLHFVVINYHASGMPYGIFDCYIFSQNGRFEYGAVLLGPYRTERLPHVYLQPSGKGLTIWFDDDYRKAYGSLYLEREGIIFHDSDVMNSSCIGVPLYRTETVLN